MQKVEIYYDIVDAWTGMNKYLDSGWKIHTCAVGSFMAGYSSKDHIIVVYER